MTQITKVQHKESQSGGSSGPSLVLDTDPIENNVIYAGVVVNQVAGNVTPAIGGTGWVDMGTVNVGSSVKLRVWRKIVPAGMSKTISASWSGNRSNVIFAVELDKVDIAGPEDLIATATGTNNNMVTGTTGQTNLNNEMWLGFIGSAENYQNLDYASPLNGFSLYAKGHTGTVGPPDKSGILWGLLSKPVSAKNSASSGVTAPTGDDYVGMMITVKERTPVTYAKSGSLVMAAALTGAKARQFSKSGAFIADSKISGGRVTVLSKTGQVKIDNALVSGARPSFHVKTGILKLEGKLSGVPLHLAGATFTRDTLKHLFGNASARINTSGSGANQGGYIPFTPINGGKHTVSIYTWATVPLRLRITDNSGSNVTVGDAVEGIDGWQRLVLTSDVSLNFGQTYRMYIETTEAVGTVYWIDGAQAEQRDAASVFADGIRPAGQGPVGNALRSQKPAGLVMDYRVMEGQDFEQLRDTHVDFQDVKDDYDTFEDARDDEPIP